jgi:hypothetical protein
MMDSSDDEAEASKQRKTSLLNELRKAYMKPKRLAKSNLKKNVLKKTKFEDEQDSTDSNDTRWSNLHSNANASKSTRRIEIGWMHKEEAGSGYSQVRARNGGGTRKLTVFKTETKKELLDKGKALFFPNGNSSKGNEAIMKFDLYDYQQNEFPDTISVGELNSKTLLSCLRFYIVTMPLELVSTSNSLEQTSSQKRIHGIGESSVSL